MNTKIFYIYPDHRVDASCSPDSAIRLALIHLVWVDGKRALHMDGEAEGTWTIPLPTGPAKAVDFCEALELGVSQKNLAGVALELECSLRGKTFLTSSQHINCKPNMTGWA